MIDPKLTDKENLTRVLEGLPLDKVQREQATAILETINEKTTQEILGHFERFLDQMESLTEAVEVLQKKRIEDEKQSG
jgi:hypothetical protein